MPPPEASQRPTRSSTMKVKRLLKTNYMKQVFFYVFFWIFSISLNATDKIEATTQQTFSKAHIDVVTGNEPIRLKDIDATNPIFIFR